jgi:chemotaxis protein CheD
MVRDSNILIVRVSDLLVSNVLDCTLATYSLGSCIAVAAYDPVLRIGGLLHYQLPVAQEDSLRTHQNPAMFADTGMALMLNQLAMLGAEKRRLQLYLAGGARMLAGPDVFDIGRRNHTAIRKILWQHGLLIKAEDVGGTSPRHLFLRIADGNVTIKITGQDAAA